RSIVGGYKATIWERVLSGASPACVTHCQSSAYPDWRDSQATRSEIPTANEQASKKEPPYEKNGSGMPVMGSRFTVIPTFSMMCENKSPEIPKTHRLE